MSAAPPPPPETPESCPRSSADAGHRHIVLVGAGHAHLHLLRHAKRLAPARVTLIDPGGFWYSGLASAMLAGQASPSQDRIDPAEVCRRQGIRLIRAKLVAIDHQARRVHLSDATSLRYDRLSLNLGSASRALAAATPGPTCWPVKPIPGLLILRRTLTQELTHKPRLRIAVIGQGATGIEVACAIRSLGRRLGVAPERLAITVVGRAEAPLADAPAKAQRWLSARLDERHIAQVNATDVVATTATGITLKAHQAPAGVSPTHLACDHVVMAGGLGPTALSRTLGLRVIEGRGIAVAHTLQCADQTNIFAAGDCAALLDQPLPRLGVHGVRQGPVLLDNLIASLQGAPLTRYHPPKRVLSILNLGDGDGLLLYGRWWLGGHLASRVKSWLDRRFLDGLRRITPSAVPAEASTSGSKSATL